MKSYILTYLMLFLSSTALFADEKTEDKIYQQSKEYRQEISQDNKQFIKHLEEQSDEYTKFIMVERKEHQDFVERIYSKFIWLVGIIGIIVGVIFTFFGFRTRKEFKEFLGEKVELYKEEANTTISKRISEIVNGRTDIIYSIIRNNDIENFIKSEKKIVILQSNSNTSCSIESSLKHDLNFKTVITKNVQDFIVKETLTDEASKYDLFIFDDKDNLITDEKRKLFTLADQKKFSVLYVGDKNLASDETCRFNVGAARFYGQIYQNCLNLLKYQHDLNIHNQ